MASNTPIIVPDLVRKLAAFRRGLVQERKQRQLLELQLEECQLRNEQLVLQQREQDVQLATSLGLSAQLEHALQMSAIEPVQSSGIHERELEGIFAKPKKEAEGEIKRLFAELSTIQQYYHALEKRALSEKVSSETSNKKLSRDLRTAVDALDRSQAETRKFKLLMQDHVQSLTETREEMASRSAEHAHRVQQMQQTIEELKEKLSSKESQIEQLQSEVEDQKCLNASLSQKSTQLASKVDSLELTVKRFTCTRILPHANYNVTCDLSIKRIPSTGEVWLCVRDLKAAGMLASVVGGAVSPLLTNSGGELEGEYSQEISTVRCRAVDEEQVRSMAAGDHETEVIRAAMDTHVRSGADEAGLFSPSAVTGGDTSSVTPTVLLGYRPRFILCFTADHHRCMIFETEATHFRDTICATLQQFLQVHKEQHIDELGRFFGGK